jgi:PAS domain S-box-containing protein
MRVAPSETATLFRTTAWEQTVLGPVERWPQALRIAVGICLNSRFPMFVWWGPELINIYNDAYVPILGQRHPEAFGRPARASWQEIWDVVGPQADAVMQRGEATWNERALLVMERNRYREDTYFTWSYSPIPDGAGGIGGLFCACTEETQRVSAERERDRLLERIETERARLAETFARSPAFIAVLHGPDHVFQFVNERYAQLIGRRDILGKPVRQALPEIEGQGFIEVLDHVYQTGEPFVGTRVLVMLQKQPSGALEPAYLDFVYQPMQGPDGKVSDILVHGVDVSEQTRVERTLRESEARFRQLADAMPQIVFAAQPDGNIDYFNRQWYEYTGLPEGTVGLDSARRVHTDDGWRGAMERWLHALRTGEPYEIEYPLRRHDGTYRWHLGRALPIRDEDGRIVQWFGTNTDIHDHKRIEHALAAEKKALEQIAMGLPLHEVLDMIARGVEDQSADRMLCSVLILDESGERLMHGAAPSLPDAYNRAIHNVRIGPRAGSCGTAAFERRDVFVTDIAADPLWDDYRGLALEHGLGACCSTPVIGTNGRVLGTVAMYYREPHEPSVHDLELARSATHLVGIVIERHQIDQQLRRSLAAEQAARSVAERASRMKDEFLATLSHEIRTPLNAILGWSQIIRHRSELPEDLAKGMDVIERNARAQAKIIEDLLDMSAIVSGKVTLRVQPLNLVAVVQTAVDTARPAADAKRMRLGYVRDCPPSVAISGDADRLQQVFWNLLSNAIKFTPPEGEVRVSLRWTGSQAEVDVTDTGEGIAPEFLPFVFERFRQADASTTRRHGGLGLGLAIVKQLVELHGGTVQATSPGAGRGASFVVALPAAAIPQQLLQEPGPQLVRAAATAPFMAAEAALAGLNVLVVDDEADARDMVERLLEHAGASVRTADSAAAAVRALQERRFDVLVSDLGMPDEDGYSLMRRIRALPDGAGGDIPAVALTAYARAEDRMRAISAGFQLHLAKPIDGATLISMVASLAARS